MVKEPIMPEPEVRVSAAPVAGVVVADTSPVPVRLPEVLVVRVV